MSIPSVRGNSVAISSGVQRPSFWMVRTGAGLAVAEVYVTRAEHLAQLSGEPWDRLRFARETLPGFVRAIRGR